MMWQVPGGTYWNPFGELARVNREMSRLADAFRGVQGIDAGDFPAASMWTNEDQTLMTVELPDVNPEELDITVKDTVLTLRGKREEEALGENEKYIRQERGTGSFVRSFSLPHRVDSEKVSAEYRNGILYLTLPRRDMDKPRKIAVKADTA
ncbi:MAG: Hsp20/alpha crystallin family protein [Candidatus Pacebacteria bacterium]|nr:Hsp20/alpha crystallin family protein [Candidatus Paceibacterota bacterium]